MNALVTSNGFFGSDMSITWAPVRSHVGSRKAVRKANLPKAETSAIRPSFPEPAGLVTSALPTNLTPWLIGGK